MYSILPHQRKLHDVTFCKITGLPSEDRRRGQCTAGQIFKNKRCIWIEFSKLGGMKELAVPLWEQNDAAGQCKILRRSAASPRISDHPFSDRITIEDQIFNFPKVKTLAATKLLMFRLEGKTLHVQWIMPSEVLGEGQLKQSESAVAASDLI